MYGIFVRSVCTMEFKVMDIKSLINYMARIKKLWTLIAIQFEKKELS